MHRSIFPVLLTLLLVVGPAGASDLDTLRDGGWLARAASEYLVAFAARDESALRTYVSTHRDESSLARTPVDARVARQMQFATMLGAIEIASVDEMTASRVVVVVRSPKTGGYFEMLFEASVDQPGKIGTQGMKPTEAPGKEATLDGAETLQAVADRLLEVVPAPGLAVAIASTDGSVDVAVAGLRHFGVDDPVRPNDTFHMGSLTKSMTAAVALRLASEGRLDLDARLTSLLDDVSIDPGYADVTFADLLAHRAGVEPLTEGEPVREASWRAAGDDPRSQRLAMARDVLSKAPTTTPGTTMVYSNAGYAIAAVVMERITDTAWEDLVRAHVFAPLDLASAHTGWPWAVDEETTRGHFTRADVVLVQPKLGYALDGPLAPAGDTSMSVGDLARLGVAHLRALDGDASWLDPALAARMHQPADGAATGYGFGWSIDRVGDHVIHQHAGSAGTYYALIAIEPATGHSIAIVFNAGDLGLQAAANRFVEWAVAR